MTVLREMDMPCGDARGRLIVGAAVAQATLAQLRTFYGANGLRHEGLVFWLGRRIGGDSLVLGALIPDADHEPFRVIADEHAVGKAARVARKHGLAVIAQVHSHPGGDTCHSDGDDRLILLPSEGMFSLVVSHYGGGGIHPGSGVGVHQYQSGRWVKIAPLTDAVLTVVPDVTDMRIR